MVGKDRDGATNQKTGFRSQTLAGRLIDPAILHTESAEFSLTRSPSRFALHRSAYIRLKLVKDMHTSEFKETEAPRGGNDA